MASQRSSRFVDFRLLSQIVSCFSFFLISTLLGEFSEINVVAAQTTNPTDLQVLHEMMFSMNSEYDWDTYFPDPCVSGPQGIVCTPDPVTNVLYVTQMQFGYISPIANIIPCSANATIPSSIAKLTRLDTLSFYNCFMNSSVTIPAAISVLGPSLRLLSFSGNLGLTGSIPQGFGNLTGLQRLVLSQNALQGNVPEELGHLPLLIQLDLSHNNFSGPVPATLATLPKLLNMDLRYNSLEGGFPSSFSQGLHQLQRLALSYNKLTGSLPENFSGLGSLTFLDLSHNQLTGQVPSSLGSLGVLEDLFLNSNSLEGPIPDSLGSLTKLVRLDLSSCSLGSTIPDSLKNLANLRFLSMSNNKLTGEIPPSLASLPRIFTLNLDGNELSGPVPFPPTFVKRMGRNMRLGDNPGLCYTPQLVSIKVPLGLSKCPAVPPLPARAPTPPPPVTPNAASRRMTTFRWNIVLALMMLVAFTSVF
ncbi:hypothetical protein M758_3G067400 [Ceratodon purpureus]|nr:hypothetical protein M758_3G067400 [Ceratodon purpureus]